MNAETSCLWG